MEHPTDGTGPEVPPTEPGTQPPEPASPVSPPASGLDYTIATRPQPPEPVQWKRQSPFPTAIIAFLAAMAGSLATVALLSLAGFFASGDEDVAVPPSTTAAVTTTLASTSTAPATEIERLTAAVWQKVNPSIVTVEIFESGNSDADFPDASGSGVAIGNGYIATNQHVIEGAETVRIVLQDGKIYSADIVGSDSLTDLAVLTADADDLTPIDLGSTNDLSIGEPTIAVGNPLGQSGGASLTVGVLSAFSRRVDFDDGTTLFGMLQTDAPINNGSSGGALVDEDGALIGITAAVGLGEAGAEGIGYAIPVELVRRITDEIIEEGTVRHAFLGISGLDRLDETTDGGLIPAGAEIEEVESGYSAERAGIEVGDIVVSLDGNPVDTMNALVVQLRLYRVGDVVDVGVVRNGEELQLPVTLDERPEGV